VIHFSRKWETKFWTLIS